MSRMPIGSVELPARCLLERIRNELGRTDQPEASWLLFLPAALKNRRPEVLSDVTRSMVQGYVYTLSKESQGCREVQEAFDAAPTDVEREALALELKGKIDATMRCPYGNFVVQKIVTSLRPQSCQFIIDEIIKSGVVRAARHVYACRVLERLIEHCEERQLRHLVETLLENFQVLAKAPYSNFVLQHLFEHGSDDVQRRLADILEGQIVELGLHPHGGAVVRQALEGGDNELRHRLVHSILQEGDLIVQMACTRHGHLAVKAVLGRGSIDDHLRDMAVASLNSSRSKLVATKYGQLVASSLDD